MKRTNPPLTTADPHGLSLMVHDITVQSAGVLFLK